MKGIWLFFLFLLPMTLFSQDGALRDYKTLPKNLKPVDSMMIEKYHGNGQLRESGKQYVYETEAATYQLTAGYYLEYYRDGTYKRITQYDNYGKAISCQSFLSGNDIWFQQEATRIKTDAANIKDFLDKDMRYESVYIESTYRYSYPLGCNYLHKEGLKDKDDKKIGTWVFYNPDGTIKKEKNY